ncbi:MAG: PDZ domain-containing protein, partial [Pirellulaceae bacterium]|nr:PDZ domain-containing protein [Pirellulaceae bacterium]
MAVLIVQTSSAQDDWTDSFKWREIGPTATGGRVTDIAVFPDNEHHILVASAAGGLWETTNNGTTWNCIFENEGTITIGDVAIDPSNSSNIWIGSGEANNQRSSLWGDGVYKSTDGGKTWTNMGLKDSQHIGRVVVHPTNGDTVFVAALGNLYSASPERGLFKTSDGGKTWNKVLFVNNDVGVVDVIVDPKNPDNVIAASYERRRRAWDFDGAGPGSAIYRSTDGGESFEKVTDGLPSGEIGRIGLDYFAKDPSVVYATVSNQNPAPAGQANQQQRGRPPRDGAPGVLLTQDQGDQGDQDAMPDDQLPEEPTDDTEIKTTLGFSIDLSTSQPTIKDVARNGVAQRAGMRNGDVVVSAGGIDGSQAKQISRFFADAKSSDRITIVVKRDGAEQTMSLTPPPTRPQRARQIGGEVYRSDDGGS